jgi:hypothetical protein
MSRRGLTRAWTGPSIRSKPRTARYHAIAESMSATRMPAWFTGSGEICRTREVSASAQPARSQRRSAVLARRAAADDDHVVVAHEGSSSPACSRTM